jgi:hypothetical protein
VTRQQAINAKCKDCIYDPKSGLGTWRQQVELCQIKTCSLWVYRPKARKPIGAGKTHAPQENLEKEGVD